MSRKPGLGARYIQSHRKWHKDGQRNYAQVNGITTRLPRFYKERIFTALERARLALESLDIDTAEYQKAVEAMSKFHPDPENYYYERLVHMHERYKEKVNQLNTF